MDNNTELIDYLVDAIERNGKAKKVRKNDKARSISYIANMGEPTFAKRRLISIMLKMMQAGLIEFVRSEPRIEWNETDFPVLLVKSDKVKQKMAELIMGQ
ncbi:hypothetical protein [Furfurilactobacillus siliginis]|uniref:Uncharacterized protein n=1 Tax=Furfurilactobacillus siliginis TaxID=348151 RepID=A0A0R2L0M2_9LACO|nr:hypothetical protein [Furfurilactobacillus siliginis]KRN95337.1 hypothetical protein IV55_GL000324 [Furfurilactobacillus siliginis]GEK28265.1 hypothetical protein LSI01_05760 [Furfurilactobacillus siliginis]